MRKRLLLSLVLAVVMVMAFAVPVFGAPDDDITVTATPAYISITIAQDTWAPNDIVGDGVTPKGTIAPATTYYANPLGDATAPTAGEIADGECYFEIANASTVATNITVNFPDFTGGDAMVNSTGGYTDAEAGEFGASGYIPGGAWPGTAVILLATGSDPLEEALAITTNLLFGIAIKTQSDVWTSGDAMSATVDVTATIDV